jgi:hypothetical protein
MRTEDSYEFRYWRDSVSTSSSTYLYP